MTDTAVTLFCIIAAFAAGFFIMRRVDRMMEKNRREPEKDRKRRGRADKKGR